MARRIDLDCLLNPDFPAQAKSKYLFVESHHGGFRARTKVGDSLQQIATGETEKECAERVALWFESHYGRNWPGVLTWFANRKYASAWDVRWNEDDKCFMVAVHLFGVPRTIFPLDSFPQKTVNGIGFYSKAQAALYVRWWLNTEFGLFSEHVLWRCEGFWEPEPPNCWWYGRRCERRPVERRERRTAVPQPGLFDRLSKRSSGRRPSRLTLAA